MTLTIGIRCPDGVVVGTDSAAPYGPYELAPTIPQLFRHKIAIIDDRVIVAGTGAIGLGQRFAAITRRHWEDKGFQNKTAVEIGKILAQNALTDFAQTGINLLKPPGNNPESYGALVAIPSKQDPALIEFPTVGFQPEVKTGDLWYACMGSGQYVADPLLRFLRATFWETNAPSSCQEGIFAATMVLKLSSHMAPIDVAEPIQMVVLGPEPSKRGQLHAHRLTADELFEHEQNVMEAMEYFREYREILRGKGEQIPNPPVPPFSTRP